MSTPFYDLASLVVVPSGYKASKVYAQKPLTTDGQLTFSRASTATRVASNGLIEKVRTNLFQFSEQLSNAYWGKTASGTALAPVITENFAPAPDGSNTAERAYFNAVGTLSTDRSGLVRQLAFTTGQTYTISVYAKSATGANQILQFRLCGSQVGSEKTVTNNWQRFTETFTATTSITDDFGIQIRGNNSVNTSDLILWGFQLELSDVMTDYIPTTTAAVSVGPVANVPRLDYLNSSCPRLLLEPQTTALNQFSESFDNAFWIKNDVTIEANTTDTLDPAGYYGADKVVETATAARHRVAAGSTTISAANHTASVFMKKGTARYGFVTFSGAAVSTIVVDLENGTITSTSTSGTIVAQKVEDYGSGWYRISVTALGTATTTTYTLQFGSAGSATPSYTSNIPSFTGSTSNYLYAWGANLTATSYLQSYIPTLGAAVTRGADDFTKTGISSLIGQTEGTLFVDFIPANTPVSGVQQWLFFLGSGGTYIGFLITSGGKLRGNVANTTDQAVIDTSYNLVSGTTYKAALAYKQNDFALYVNGVQIGLDTSGTVPAVSSLRANYNTTAANMVNAKYNQALLFKTRLTNAQLAELTTL